jgi:hypothetical protein
MCNCADFWAGCMSAPDAKVTVFEIRICRVEYLRCELILREIGDCVLTIL